MSSLLKLPSSAQHRNAVCHIKLLTRVDREASHALGFEGKIFRPGGMIDRDALPRPALLLECAGVTGTRKNRQMVWILWKYDPDSNEWREMVRAHAPDWTWSIAIRPIAARELSGDTDTPIVIWEIADRIVKVIDTELAGIPQEFRAAVLSAIDPEIAGRIANFLE